MSFQLTELQKSNLSTITLGKYTLAYSTDPLGVEISNINMDLIVLTSGFFFRVEWNYPEADLTAPASFINITSGYSQVYNNEHSPLTFIYTGGGNITVLNIDLTDAFMLLTNGKGTIGIAYETAWIPDDGLTHIVEAHNFTMTLRENLSMAKYNGFVLTFPFVSSRYVKMNITGELVKLLKNHILLAIKLIIWYRCRYIRLPPWDCCAYISSLSKRFRRTLYVQYEV